MNEFLLDSQLQELIGLHWADPIEDDEDNKKLGYSLFTVVNQIVELHKERLDTLKSGISLYDNCKYGTLMEAAMQRPAEGWKESDEITVNVLRTIVASLNSKISKNKILPRILTSNARWNKREEAKKLDKYIRGLFYQLKATKVMKEANLDCLLTGDGFVKVCNDGSNIYLERCLPDEVFVDYIDGMYGSPKAMFQIRVVGIRNLIHLYPEHADVLKDLYQANSGVLQLAGTSTSPNVLVNSGAVVEAWSLPVGNLPGKHVISLGTTVLEVEEWDKDYFPFVHLQYTKPERGYYTKGIFQEIAPLQREAQKVIQRISDEQRLMSNVVYKRKRGSKIEDSLITNEIGTIIDVDNMDDLQVVPPPPMSGEKLGYLNQIVQKMYEMSGVSQLSASSRLPAGIDGASARALREYNDIQTERFALLAQEWEDAHESLAELVIKEINSNGKFPVKCFDREGQLETIDFVDLGLDIDNITVGIFPVSALPSTPEAKLATLNEWVTSGLIDKKDMMDLMDAPDLDAFSVIENAPKRAVDRIINSILDDQIYIPPEDLMDLDYLKKQSVLYYNKMLESGKVDKHGAYDKLTNVILDLFRQLVEDTAALLEKATAPATPPPAPGGPPPGTPGEIGPSTLPPDLHITPSPEAMGLAAAGGQLPPSMGRGKLPPEAIANAGGIQ